MFKKYLIFSWILVSVLFLIYSFTQIDLSLTFSKASVFQTVQKSLQYIGYFQRPISAYIFIGLLSSLTLLYIITLVLSIKGKLETKDIWKIIMAVSSILFFSYNAFSYDFFNYIFDAKIITHYHQNPYLQKALDFPSDPMLSFMRSTHRVYPYGPSWLLFTVPLSFVGLNFFLPTFYLFKALIIGCFLGTVYFIGKILVHLKSKNLSFAMVFFALNPLVIIESLISAHNDIVMIFLAISALHFLFKKNYILSIILLILSIGIKFATIILIPFFLFVIYKQIKNKDINYNTFFYALFIIMVLAAVLISFASGQNKNPEFQPWYLLSVLPFAAFVSKSRLVVTITVFVSVGALLSYLPYIYMGEWPKNIVDLKVILLSIALVLGILFYYINKSFFAKK